MLDWLNLLFSKHVVDINVLAELGFDLAFELGSEEAKKRHVGFDDKHRGTHAPELADRRKDGDGAERDEMTFFMNDHLDQEHADESEGVYPDLLDGLS